MKTTQAIEKVLSDVRQQKKSIDTRLNVLLVAIADAGEDAKAREKLETEHASLTLRSQGLEIQRQTLVAEFEETSRSELLKEYLDNQESEALLIAKQGANNDKIQELKQEIERLKKENAHPLGRQRSDLIDRRRAIAAHFTGEAHNPIKFEQEFLSDYQQSEQKNAV
jgi:hypothetical protein